MRRQELIHLQMQMEVQEKCTICCLIIRDLWKEEPGYIRLMHFDVEGQRMIVRTFTPSYGGSDFSNYGDYDAKPIRNTKSWK